MATSSLQDDVEIETEISAIDEMDWSTSTLPFKIIEAEESTENGCRKTAFNVPAVTPQENENETIKANFCKLCKKSFAKSTNLYKHVRNIHKTIPAYRVACKVCSECNMKLQSQSALRRHMQSLHGLDLGRKLIRFQSLETFYKWKELEEAKECCSFQNRHKYAIKKNGQPDTIQQFFSCNRDGVFDSKVNARKRKLKKTGSVRSGFSCTAGMKLSVCDGNILLEYYKTHVGHDKDWKHLRFSNSVKEYIIGKLKQNETSQQIVKELQERAPENSKLKQITVKDVTNLKRWIQKESTDTHDAIYIPEVPSDDELDEPETQVKASAPNPPSQDVPESTSKPKKVPVKVIPVKLKPNRKSKTLGSSSGTQTKSKLRSRKAKVKFILDMLETSKNLFTIHEKSIPLDTMNLLVETVTNLHDVLSACSSTNSEKQ